MGPSALQQNTSISGVFVLGALVRAMLLSTWWVRPPSMTVGVGNPTTAAKQHYTISSSPDLSIPMHSNPSQAMFSDGCATSCAAGFEQLCGSRVTFLLLCFHVGNLRVETSCGNDARGVVMRSQAVRDFTILARV